MVEKLAFVWLTCVVSQNEINCLETEKKNNSIHSTKMMEQERENNFCYLTFWNSRNLIQTEWNFFFLENC